MTHKINQCIEWITSIHTLGPGDIVATGTDHRGLNPFQDGDQIEMETEGLGRLHFVVGMNSNAPGQGKLACSASLSIAGKNASINREIFHFLTPGWHLAIRSPLASLNTVESLSKVKFIKKQKIYDVHL